MPAFRAPWGLADRGHLGDMRRVRAVLWSAAALATLALLLSLSLVMQDHVRQAALRHAATAAQTDALWRCNALPGRDARDTCRRVAGLPAPGAAD